MLRALAILGLVFATSGTISDCDPTSIFRPTTLTLTPDPPISGEPVYLGLIFDNTGTEVTGGTATSSVTLNGLPLSPDVKPLCEGVVCPILSGSNNRSTESSWPSVSGKVVTKFTWTGAGGESLLCITSTVKVLDNTTITNSTDLQVYRKSLRG